MILIPKYKDLHARGKIQVRAGIQGEVRCILYKRDEITVVSDTGWKPNLITDNGLNTYFTESNPKWSKYTHIGDDTTPAANSDTQLGNRLASSDTSGSGGGVNIYNSAPDYEYSSTQSRRFDAGVGTGTINEIGMSHLADGTSLFNRVIVSPGIVKAFDQVLDVIFRITHWPQVNDQAGTVSIGGISYNTNTRGSSYLPNINAVFDAIRETSLFTSDWQAYDGNIGTIEGVPTGDAGPGSTNIVTSGYVPNSHYMDMTHFAGLNEWNPTLGIRSIRCKTNIRSLQTQFDAVSGGARIPKDGTKILDITWRYSWARH